MNYLPTPTSVQKSNASLISTKKSACSEVLTSALNTW